MKYCSANLYINQFIQMSFWYAHYFYYLTKLNNLPIPYLMSTHHCKMINLISSILLIDTQYYSQLSKLLIPLIRNSELRH